MKRPYLGGLRLYSAKTSAPTRDSFASRRPRRSDTEPWRIGPRSRAPIAEFGGSWAFWLPRRTSGCEAGVAGLPTQPDVTRRTAVRHSATAATTRGRTRDGRDGFDEIVSSSAVPPDSDIHNNECCVSIITEMKLRLPYSGYPDWLSRHCGRREVQCMAIWGLGGPFGGMAPMISGSRIYTSDMKRGATPIHSVSLTGDDRMVGE
jgi:hypothetical protein